MAGSSSHASSVVLKSPRKMAPAFALSVVQDSIQRLDSCQQQDDYSSLVLRLEYLNRTIVNSGELPDSVVAGIGLAIRCLQEQQEAVTRRSCSRVARTFFWPTWSPFFSSRRRATVLHVSIFITHPLILARFYWVLYITW